ncbi:MAG: IS110 family transposase [Acidobacteria bacterium]|nr:IS110 family transposase [Acidobacteriota bacterium]
MTLLSLGIDVSKQKFDVALLRDTGKFKHRVFPNSTAGFSQLSAWLIKQKAERVHACLEATGAYSDSLAAYLHEQGHVVSVVNPAQIKAYAESHLTRAKTDKADATLIARFCSERHPPAWSPLSRASARLTGTRPPPRLPARDAADGGKPARGGGHRRRQGVHRRAPRLPR